MSKKLQVFISSTYTDLIDERQAAVAAVLKAGHIPAGMELFSAGDRSQLLTIRSWIEQSDAYMLILGGRYGSIESESGRSYTELEYDYALELGKPLFAIVITDNGLDKKLKEKGAEVMERENGLLLREFRKKVLSNVSSFFDEPKDIRLAVFESLPDLSNNRDLVGWVRGDQIVNTQPLVDEVKKLSDENTTLRAKLTQLEKQVGKKNEGKSDFENKLRILQKKIIPPFDGMKIETKEVPALAWLKVFRDRLVTGVYNSMGMSDQDNFIFFKLGPELATLNLVDYQKVTGKVYQRCSLTAMGKQFLAQMSLSDLDEPQAQALSVEAEVKSSDANTSSAPTSASEKLAGAAASKTPKVKRVVNKKST